MNHLWIQLILVLGAVVAAFQFIRRWDRANTRAWKRIAFSLFVVANIIAVLWPTGVTKVASLVGVGRGTDLVLYLMVIAMAFLALNTYLRFRSLEKKLTDLARTVAINEGVRLNNDRLDVSVPTERVSTPAER
ncbi:DUF2304 domain-containing protein [Kitasatospora sp. NBC_01287]|uniref:DUF2304 domain-containing protein n=1 Tax=Kitasatospora sp. NBC_01287 TaxID=2903573 RepID=UPI00224CC7F4|nr:DUF2304 domain-containing protein [Kitasatospora sp. NBC_01287]MCX4748468.1 DUF2304 domain-containing protein [Kitasatospora sp. NBC_01287]